MKRSGGHQGRDRRSNQRGGKPHQPHSHGGSSHGGGSGRPRHTGGGGGARSHGGGSAGGGGGGGGAGGWQRRRGPSGPARHGPKACPMCGAVVPDLARHIRDRHDDPHSHPRD